MIEETVRQQLRADADTLRNSVGGRGRSRDDVARVLVNGMGDLVAVRIAAPGLPPELASRISAAVVEAWRAAGHAHALAESEGMPPEVAARLRELADQRFVEPSPTELAS